MQKNELREQASMHASALGKKYEKRYEDKDRSFLWYTVVFVGVVRGFFRSGG